jgi:phospholipase C
MRAAIFLATALLLFAATACGGNGSSPGSAPLIQGAKHGGVSPATGSGSNYISHVVVIIQENRSFDDFFATFPGANGTTTGLMKTPSGDVVVPLKAAGLHTDNLGHQHASFLKEYDGGKMDGFNLVTRTIAKGHDVPAGTYAYRYVDPKEIAPYWSIAKDYVLADDMFTTQSSSSFTAHQDFVAGGTPVDGDNVIDFPRPPTWGCNGAPGTKTNLITVEGKYLWGKGPFPCFTYATIRDDLDGAGLSWLYFTNPSNSAVWDAFDAIKAVREGSEWSTNIIEPETEVLNYIDNGELPAVSWVIPDAGTSDHPHLGFSKDKGPEWVASVVNAIGESPYWQSTVVIVVWDEWGGNYDHVPPPQLDGQGLGARVPMMIVSAYDKETTSGTPGYISHTQYEDGSILKFIENLWSLPPLGTSDVRANSIADCFDFAQSPRAFIPIKSSLSKHYFERQYKPSSAPIDEY